MLDGLRRRLKEREKRGKTKKGRNGKRSIRRTGGDASGHEVSLVTAATEKTDRKSVV